MKLFISIFCLIAPIVVLTSCKKQQSNADNSSSPVGTWELRQGQWGMQPTMSFSAGNGNLLVFSDSLYALYKNGSRVKSGHYILIKDSTVQEETGLVISAGQFTRRIVYDNDYSAHKIFIEVSHNQLNILSGFFPYDGGSSEAYARISTDTTISLVP
jgi:hypothetical protein